MRITAQLIQVATDSHLWSNTYDRELDDIFAVQDDIAQSVVTELRASLMGEHLASQASAEAKADVQAAWGWVPFAAGFERAREAAKRSLALAPDLAEGHVCLGLVYLRGDWDLAAAEVEFQRAFELAPGNVDVLRARAGLAGVLGRRDEAIELRKKAFALDPLSTSTLCALGVSYAGVGRFDDAATMLHAALDLNPKAGIVHSQLSHIRLRQGRAEEALAEAAMESHPVLRLTDTALAHHALGHVAESDAALARLIADHAEIAAYDIAQLCAQRGEVDRAFEWLERGYAQRDSGMPLCQNDRLLMPLHDDPRWAPFMKKMGFA